MHMAPKHHESAPCLCQAHNVGMSSERHTKIHEGQQKHKRETTFYSGYPITYDPTRTRDHGLKVCSREESLEYWKREKEPEANKTESTNKPEVEVQESNETNISIEEQEKQDHVATVVSTVCHQ